MITLTHETAQRRLILRSISRSARGIGNLPVSMRYNRVPGDSGFASESNRIRQSTHFSAATVLGIERLDHPGKPLQSAT